MSSENWNRINELFYATLDQPREQRQAFLKEACGLDMALQQEVESLLVAYEKSENFIQSPPVKDAMDFLSQREIHLAPGDRIGAYNIVREIGRGGMGAVYLGARADERFQKLVAIKLIKRGMDTDDVLRHFRIEQQILGNFDHPNIARLIDAGSTDSGLPYFIMEFVEGQPIDQYCDQKSLSISQRLELFEHVCSAVSYAHRNLVVHRDIKPTNILVTADGTPKLLDFGIAKILQSDSAGRSTATGIHFMTPEYASPEQAQGLQVNTLSDVYSLGVLLYELLTGHSPYQFKNRSSLEVLKIITETQPQLPSSVIYISDRSSEDTLPLLTAEAVSKTREGNPERLRRRLRGDLDNIVLMSMRKEPHRRYQSVDQLTEDIRRHLQGLPINARRDIFAYRTARFLLRNRVAVVMIVLALIAFALFGTVMQWKANRQAKMYQEFGQEVSRIEAAMRFAYLLPLHNIQRDKERVLQRLEHIKNQMEEMGKLTHGVGHYSLGRGYISLHRYQDAYDNLILAWQKYQYQEPAVANALGLSMAMLYQKKLREAQELFNEEQLNERKSELEKQYRLPALQYIQKGANASESPEYVQALLAFLAKQYPQALRMAHAAQENLSWHYESKKLQGDIFTTMGHEKSDAGKIAEAFELYEKAKLAYLEAAKKGQSDPEIYNALCTVQSSIQQIDIELKRKTSQEGVDEAINYCKKALQIDSKDITANLLASRIYTDWAYYQTDHGLDPSIAVEKSADYARAALKIDSENPLAHLALGEAYSTRSNFEINRGRDPVQYLELSDVSYAKASEKIPEDHGLLFLLANNSIKLAQYYSDKGMDPRPALEKTIRYSQKATGLNRQNYKNYTMLGHAYYFKGQYEHNIGSDARQSLKSSIQHLNESIRINQNYLVPYIWCGNSYMVLAEQNFNSGEDPHPALDEAIKIFRKSVAIDPQYSWGHNGAGIALALKSEYLQKAEKDPTATLDMAREEFKKALALDSSNVYFYYFSADAELIAARDAVLRKTPPEPFFKETERIVQACLKINSEADSCLESLTALHLVRAEHLVSSRRSPEKEIQSGIGIAEKTIKINPTNGIASAHRGKLFLVRARYSSGAVREKAAKEAQASFEHAFKLQNVLRREYGKDFDEAKELASGGS
jgi:serine/threonine protein kinase